MTALLSLPGVPAIYFCMAGCPGGNAARVSQDPSLRGRGSHLLDRVLYEARIPQEKTLLLLNFVDLKRFQPVARSPKPRRALIFSKSRPAE